MSINTSTHAVCRLLGGSGRAPLLAVPARKLPSLLAPSAPSPAATHSISFGLPLAA